jgi:hypothetical protein
VQRVLCRLGQPGLHALNCGPIRLLSSAGIIPGPHGPSWLPAHVKSPTNGSPDDLAVAMSSGSGRDSGPTPSQASFSRVHPPRSLLAPSIISTVTSSFSIGISYLKEECADRSRAQVPMSVPRLTLQWLEEGLSTQSTLVPVLNLSVSLIRDHLSHSIKGKKRRKGGTNGTMQ